MSMNQKPFTAQEALFGVDHLNQVTFKDRKEIKAWIQERLIPLGIFIVIERSDETKIVFKCKSFSYSTNFKKVRQKRITKKEKLDLISKGKFEQQRKQQRRQRKPSRICPFRIRANHSFKTKLWSIAIVNNEHNHPLRNSVDCQFFDVGRFNRDIETAFKDQGGTAHSEITETAFFNNDNMMMVNFNKNLEKFHESSSTDNISRNDNISAERLNKSPEIFENSQIMGDIQYPLNTVSQPYQDRLENSTNMSVRENRLPSKLLHDGSGGNIGSTTGNTININNNTSSASLSNTLFTPANSLNLSIPKQESLENLYRNNNKPNRVNPKFQNNLSPVSAYLNSIAGNPTLLDSIVTDVSNFQVPTASNNENPVNNSNNNNLMSSLSPTVERIFTNINYAQQEFNLGGTSQGNVNSNIDISLPMTDNQYMTSHSSLPNPSQSSTNFSHSSLNSILSASMNSQQQQQQQRNYSSNIHQYPVVDNSNTIPIHNNNRSNTLAFTKRMNIQSKIINANNNDQTNNDTNTIPVPIFVPVAVNVPMQQYMDQTTSPHLMSHPALNVHPNSGLANTATTASVLCPDQINDSGTNGNIHYSIGNTNRRDGGNTGDNSSSNSYSDSSAHVNRW